MVTGTPASCATPYTSARPGRVSSAFARNNWCGGCTFKAFAPFSMTRAVSPAASSVKRGLTDPNAISRDGSADA